MMNNLDRVFDRVIRLDEASRNFGIMGLVPSRELISKIWYILTCLDQGNEGACVGFGITHGLLCEPHIGDPKIFTARFARERIYWEAQRNDRWAGGEYPDAKLFMSGTGVLDGLKAAKKLGVIDSYRWAFGLNELLIGLGYFGPCITGVNWYEGMSEPDRNGVIHVSGRQVGGHCILIYGVNMRTKMLLLHNSWGAKWGIKGNCQISFADFARLLAEHGVCAFITKPAATPVIH